MLYPQQHNYEACHGMVHRLISIEQFPQNNYKERSIIKQMANNNDFVADLIYKIERKHLELKAITQIYQRESNDIVREK